MVGWGSGSYGRHTNHRMSNVFRCGMRQQESKSSSVVRQSHHVPKHTPNMDNKTRWEVLFGRLYWGERDPPPDPPTLKRSLIPLPHRRAHLQLEAYYIAKQGPKGTAKRWLQTQKIVRRQQTMGILKDRTRGPARTLDWAGTQNQTKKKLNPAGCVLNRNHEHGPKPLKHTPTIFDNQIRKF